MLLVLILSLLAVAKVAYIMKGGPTTLRYDGAYYQEIARHVRDGYGLTTHVSVLHQGFSYFPHETAVYPVWPLVYGHLARFLPIGPLGVWLPSGLLLLSLVLAYRWGQRVAPRPLVPGLVPALNTGHVLVLVLGFHPELFTHTAQPYTEGLAYLILFAALLRWHGGLEHPTVLAGLEAGAWAALCFLVRSQFVVILIALYATLAWAVLIDARARTRRIYVLLAATVAVILLVAPYVAWVRTFVPGAGLGQLIRFDQARETDLLSPVSMLVTTNGPIAYAMDRASGFLVAFGLDDKFAYARSFHLFHYGLPLLLGVIAVRARGRLSRTVAVVRRWSLRPESLGQIFVLVLCVGGFLSIHTVHKAIFAEWNFPLRQGITAAPIFAFSLALLLRRSRGTVLALSVFLLAASTGLGARELVSQIDKSRPRRNPDRPEVARWLRLQAEQNGGELVVATGDPQALALRTRNVGYHAIMSQRTTLEDARRMMTDLGARYLLLPRSRFKRWVLYSDPAAFSAAFDHLLTLDNVLVLAPKGTHNNAPTRGD